MVRSLLLSAIVMVGFVPTASSQPAKAKVLVVNGTAQKGVAGQFAARLKQKGFRNVSFVPSSVKKDHSELFYRPDAKPPAEKIFNWLPLTTQPGEMNWESKFDIVVVLGKDALSTRKVKVGLRSLPAPARSLPVANQPPHPDPPPPGGREGSVSPAPPPTPADSPSATQTAAEQTQKDFPSPSALIPDPASHRRPRSEAKGMMGEGAGGGESLPAQEAVQSALATQNQEIARLREEVEELRKQLAASTAHLAGTDPPPPTAEADPPPNPEPNPAFKASLQASVLNPFGKTGQVFGQTFGAWVTVGLRFKNTWTTGLSAGGFFGRTEVSRADGTRASGSLLLLPASLILEYEFQAGRARPFVGAGPAVQVERLSDRGVFQQTLSGADSALGLGFDIRAGLRFALGSRTNLSAEVGWLSAEGTLAGSREGNGIRFSLGIGL